MKSPLYKMRGFFIWYCFMDNKKKNTEKREAKNKHHKKASRARVITATGISAAIAALLMQLQLSIPFVPNFLKLDIADFPALIAGYAYGPVAGICVCLVKNVIHLTMTTTGGVGELSNFILGVCFVVPAATIYHIGKKSKGSAFAGAIVGTLFMSVCGIFTNFYLIYPLYYYVMDLSPELLMQMYQSKMPSVSDLWQALAIFNFPLTLVKGALCTAITFMTYKYLGRWLHGQRG